MQLRKAILTTTAAATATISISNINSLIAVNVRNTALTFCSFFIRVTFIYMTFIICLLFFLFCIIFLILQHFVYRDAILNFFWIFFNFLFMWIVIRCTAFTLLYIYVSNVMSACTSFTLSLHFVNLTFIIILCLSLTIAIIIMFILCIVLICSYLTFHISIEVLASLSFAFTGTC